MEASNKLSPETRRLIAILDALTTDQMLNSLIALATGDQIAFDAPISVMVDGRLIRGRIAKPEVFAAIIDERLKTMVQTATIHSGDKASPEDQANMRKVLAESFSNAFTERLRMARERERRGWDVIERVWGPPNQDSQDDKRTIDDFDDAEALLALTALGPRRTLTLDQAELFVPPSRWDPIGVMRLSVQHIAGWWMPPIG